MSPVGNPSLFMRFFGLVENFPLYGMLGIACGLAVYTPVRHLMTAPDIYLDTAARNHMDNLASNPRVLERAQNYDKGILGAVSKMCDYPHVLPDVGVPVAHPKPAHPYVKPTSIPQP
jgi:hypothetical protein